MKEWFAPQSRSTNKCDWRIYPQLSHCLVWPFLRLGYTPFFFLARLDLLILVWLRLGQSFFIYAMSSCTCSICYGSLCTPRNVDFRTFGTWISWQRFRMWDNDFEVSNYWLGRLDWHFEKVQLIKNVFMLN
jgi:hypothetical protein